LYRSFSLIFSTAAEEGPRRGRRGAVGALLKVLTVNEIHCKEGYQDTIRCITAKYGNNGGIFASWHNKTAEAALIYKIKNAT